MSQYGNAPLSNAEAWDFFERVLADSRIARIEEPAGLEPQWKTLALLNRSSPKRWMDAYLAAFAIAGGHQLVTTDRDFQQISNLDCVVLTAS